MKDAIGSGIGSALSPRSALLWLNPGQTWLSAEEPIPQSAAFSGKVVKAIVHRLFPFMRFRNSEEPVFRATSTERARVLFVCLGNACRSQMAEGFAKSWHADILDAESAGVSPLGVVPAETAATMAEKDVLLIGHSSKGLDAFDLRSFDIIVNMSGFPFPPSLGKTLKLVEWEVDDPFTGNERRYRKTRDDIERRVRALADDIRRNGIPE